MRLHRKLTACMIAAFLILTTACFAAGAGSGSETTKEDGSPAGQEKISVQTDISGQGETSAQEFELEAQPAEDSPAVQEEAPTQEGETDEQPAEDSPAVQEDDGAKATASEKNGDVYILFTSDIHCGIDEGFGLAGLKQVRDVLEAEGYETLLVDDGDSIQGELVGTMDKGATVIDLMNELQYDVAIPGNHDFDYGVDNFLDLTKKATFPYISCNFNYKGELVFQPYIIKEAAGIKIAFVGVTTPATLVVSSPAIFRDESGQFVYGFLQDKTGKRLYQAVQDAVDAARQEGADLVYVMAHLGNQQSCSPWTYADVISHTNGIDVFLDGHSHDTDQVVMKNKDGEEVTRSAVGTKMECIGYSHITAEKEVKETGIWTWTNKESVPELLDIRNELRTKVDEVDQELSIVEDEVIATTDVKLTVDDPEKKDAEGEPIRIVRSCETNLGDFCADAYRDQTGADLALVNGGGVRVSIEKGEITYGDIIRVHPFGNNITVIEATGQQILDALEWGCHTLPSEFGGFLQVSGLTYEIDTSIENPCKEDENSMLSEIEGERRVRNVLVGDEPLDPEKTYTVASNEYLLLENGDGNTAFDGAAVLHDRDMLDSVVLINYFVDTLGGKVGSDYEDPYGQGRIKILE